MKVLWGSHLYYIKDLYIRGYIYVHYYGIRNRGSRKLLYKVLIFNLIVWVQYFLTYTWGLKKEWMNEKSFY